MFRRNHELPPEYEDYSSDDMEASFGEIDEEEMRTLKIGK
jgi:hypothetical protein